MTLTEQESRCLDLAAAALSEITGTSWLLDREARPDDTHPNEPSPDGIIRDGIHSAAVEVKRLTGDLVWNVYSEALKSLSRSLAPSTGGHWTLSPPIDFRLPMDIKTRKRVKKQLQGLKELPVGEEDAILMPRRALISLGRTDGPGQVFCCHTSSGYDELRDASARISGRYMLVDEGQLEHSFETEEGRQQFIDAVVDACNRRASGSEAFAEWNEEWGVSHDDDGEPHVQVICVTEARSVPGANAEAIDLVLDSALRKFERRRWADLHVVVLDRTGAMLMPDYLLDAVQSYDDQMFEDVDLILIAEKSETFEAWRSPTATVWP